MTTALNVAIICFRVLLIDWPTFASQLRRAGGDGVSDAAESSEDGRMSGVTLLQIVGLMGFLHRGPVPTPDRVHTE